MEENKMKNKKLFLTTSNKKIIKVTELDLNRYRKIKTLSGKLQLKFSLLDDGTILFDGLKESQSKTFKGAIKYLLQKQRLKQKQENKKRIKIDNQRLAGYIMFNGLYPKDVMLVKGKRTFYFDKIPKIDELTKQYNTITNKKRGDN